MKTISLLTFAASVAFAASAGQAFAGGDAAAGEKVFAKCKACHQVGEGAKNAVAPQLNGIDGRKAGSVEGYNYSEPMKASGIAWDEASFKEFIKNPKAKVPGTKMIFQGLASDGDQENVWAYIAQFGADGKKK
ncbi:c-type cytochrome [Methylocystis sp. WRRC1]|uniref:cytochrome c-554 n=1 Tax=unclassified Methylocystis TaxID=2625913 RepID=UPI0001F8757C|nr:MULTISPECIES: cytochrome c-554 [unclassified Methylocystis]MCC3243914.1 c-type cytochrome [Methylocystis sp. WRRC1]